MSLIAKLSVVTMLGLACAACSSNNGTPASSAAPVASASSASMAPPASAIPMTAPVAGASSTAPVAAPGNGPSLTQAMQRPGFAKAFEEMDGASALPAWVKTGGVSTPASKVTVDGKTMWLAEACQTADCKDDQLFLLIDPENHSMQGLFVENSGSAGASVRKLVWLGKPDAATQEYLKDRITKD